MEKGKEIVVVRETIERKMNKRQTREEKEKNKNKAQAEHDNNKVA
jgi:hypothetical protein